MYSAPAFSLVKLENHMNNTDYGSLYDLRQPPSPPGSAIWPPEQEQQEEEALFGGDHSFNVNNQCVAPPPSILNWWEYDDEYYNYPAALRSQQAHNNNFTKEISYLDFKDFEDEFGWWDLSSSNNNNNNNNNVSCTRVYHAKPLGSVNVGSSELVVSLSHAADVPAANPRTSEEYYDQGGATNANANARYNTNNKSASLKLDDIQKYFDVPITKAAKELDVGLTVLKKRCRELNIVRWPHRKIKSLNSLIHNLRELGVTNEIEMLEEHKRMLLALPELELTERTKKLRQSCFKANYKKRRAHLAPHLMNI